jgi:hypothetical protein
MSRLVVVVPLKEGARAKAQELLEQGPPFNIETSHLSRHEVFLSDHEVIFDFETPGSEPPIELHAEDPVLHEAAEAWREVMAGKPRKAVPAFSWDRSA